MVWSLEYHWTVRLLGIVLYVCFFSVYSLIEIQMKTQWIMIQQNQLRAPMRKTRTKSSAQEGENIQQSNNCKFS